MNQEIYDSLNDLLFEHGFNATGYNPKTGCYVVYYDRTILTENSIRNRLHPLVGELLELRGQDPPEILC